MKIPDRIRLKLTKEEIEELCLDEPYLRIGILEGAIMGALPYFEAMAEMASFALYPQCDQQRIDDSRHVIAKLKELIKNTL